VYYDLTISAREQSSSSAVT